MKSVVEVKSTKWSSSQHVTVEAGAAEDQDILRDLDQNILSSYKGSKTCHSKEKPAERIAAV